MNFIFSYLIGIAICGVTAMIAGWVIDLALKTELSAILASNSMIIGFVAVVVANVVAAVAVVKEKGSELQDYYHKILCALLRMLIFCGAMVLTRILTSLIDTG